MDYRSLFLHFECATLLAGTSSVMDLKKDCLETFRVSRMILHEDCRRTFFGSVSYTHLDVYKRQEEAQGTVRKMLDMIWMTVLQAYPLYLYSLPFIVIGLMVIKLRSKAKGRCLSLIHI